MPAARPAAGAGGSGAWGLPRGTGRKGCHAPAESLLTGESEPDRRRIEALPFKGRVGWGWVSVRAGSTTILLTGSPPPPRPSHLWHTGDAQRRESGVTHWEI